MQTIINATSDIEPNLIFNNAGYIATGLFADKPIAASLANNECNTVSSMRITHHFANLLLNNKRKGAIFFTSSPAGGMPCPMSVMYGATKAFLTEFAVSVAAELKGDGIDVCVVHPSPVATSFYSGNHHGIKAMEFFQRTATTPDKIASCFFKSIGRTIVHDQGYYALMQKIILKLMDYNALSWIIAGSTHTQADFIKSKAKRPLAK